MKIFSRLLQKVLPYHRVVWIAETRKKWRWRRNCGAGEFALINKMRSEAVKYAKYVLYLFGFSFGITIIPPELLNQLMEWWPWVGEKIIWLSNNLTKELVIGIIIAMWLGDLLMKVFYYFLGTWFEKSGFVRAEQKIGAKKFDWFTMEEIVYPLQRIEKKLGTKKDGKS